VASRCRLTSPPAVLQIAQIQEVQLAMNNPSNRNTEAFFTLQSIWNYGMRPVGDAVADRPRLVTFRLRNLYWDLDSYVPHGIDD